MATLVLPLLLHRGTTQEASSWCGVSAACRAVALQKQQGPSWSGASAPQPSAGPVPCPGRSTNPPQCWGLLGWWQELPMFLQTMTPSWAGAGCGMQALIFTSAALGTHGLVPARGQADAAAGSHQDAPDKSLPPPGCQCLGRKEMSVKAPQARETH